MIKKIKDIFGNEDGFTLIELLFVIGAFGVVVFMGFMIYVISHFVAKFW